MMSSPSYFSKVEDIFSLLYNKDSQQLLLTVHSIVFVIDLDVPPSNMNSLIAIIKFTTDVTIECTEPYNLDLYCDNGEVCVGIRTKKRYISRDIRIATDEAFMTFIGYLRDVMLRCRNNPPDRTTLFYSNGSYLSLLDISSSVKPRVSWDIYFMNIAEVVKTRSLDPKTQVGAVLVSMKDNRIISTGYNSVGAGLDDESIDWTDRDYVHNIVIHAEMNALLYARSMFEDSILYTTLSPCSGCIKMLSASKIKKVIYKNEYRDIELSRKLATFFKIEMINF